MARDCAVRLFGGFRVEVDGRAVAADAWRHRRGADLVKLLALAPQHRLHRDQVMERLWPDLEPKAAGANLRKAVHYARRALGGKESIRTEGELVALWPEGRLEVDADHAEAQTAELLPEDPYTDWIEPHRQRARTRRLEHLRATGHWGEVLAIDPTDEQACRALMRQELDQGNRQAAVRQFQRLRDVLRVDLAIPPEPATVALFEEAIALQGPLSTSPAERVQVLLANGLVRWNERDLDAAQTLAEEARALALDQQLARELGEASSLLGMVAMARGQWPTAFRQEFTSAMKMGRDQAPLVMDAQLCLAEAWVAGVDSQGTAELAHELLQVAIENRSSPAEALMSLLIGEAEFFSGHLDESNEWLSRAEDLYRGMDDGTGVALALIHIAEVDTAREHKLEALQRLRRARGLAEESVLTSHLGPRILEGMIESAESPDRSREILIEAEALVARPREICQPCSIGLRVAAAMASARAGDVGRARHWLESAERLAGMWSGGPWQAAVWEARAALREAEGDRGQAVALLREAGNLFTQCGRDLDAARCRAAIAADS